MPNHIGIVITTFTQMTKIVGLSSFSWPTVRENAKKENKQTILTLSIAPSHYLHIVEERDRVVREIVVHEILSNLA